MDKKYVCNTCNYSTDVSYCYKKHLITKKHLEHTNIDKYIELNSFTCSYCNSIFKGKHNKSRHYKVCKAKKSTEKYELLIEHLKEEYEEVIEQLKEENNKLKNDKSQLANNTTNINTQNNVKNTNSNNINMYYVMNNFNEAYNISDILKPALTQQELKDIRKKGALIGSIQFIKNRCINNLSVEKRPIHCIDMSRHKFMCRENDAWIIDEKGERLLRATFDKIAEAFPIKSLNKKDNEKDNKNNEIKLIKLTNKEYNDNLEQLIEMRHQKIKIANDIGKSCLLKNGVK